jgi:trk system potassium uptake protein TrkA
MRVIIIGGGEVGTELARQLSPDHDVVVIEQKKAIAVKIESEIDCHVIVGNGASMTVLETAGVRNAGMLIAVTETDEVNMIACMLGKRFGVEKNVARLRNPEYIAGKHVLSSELTGLDYIINPERLAAEEIAYYILNPGIVESDYYVGGRIHVSGYRVDRTFPHINRSLREVKMPAGTIICAIVRKGEVLIPGGRDVLLENDDVYVLGKTDDLSIIFWAARRLMHYQRIIIAGGGRVGLQLAQFLESSPSSRVLIKLADKDEYRCQLLAETLLRTQVYHGDVTDVNFLKSLNVSENDTFVAVTGDDEINLLSTLLAKKMGTKTTVSEVIRKDYQLILSSIGIDKVVSPRILTATMIMRLIGRGNIVSKTILREGKAEMLEVQVPEGTQLDSRKIKDLGLPEGLLLAAIARNNSIIVPDGNERILAGDRVVCFALPGRADTINKIFGGRYAYIGTFPALHKQSTGKKL